MKSKIFASIALAAAMLACSPVASAQFSLGKALSAGIKATQALTLTDAKVAEYVKESVNWMDQNNPVSAPDSPYSQRLQRLTEGLTDVDGIPLNFKVYEVVEINAFACADGSVRVFSSLMDIMDDDELLGVIGHEIGHVGLHHSRKAMKEQLLTGALKDAISSTGGVAAALTDSQLGALSESLVNAKYSQKQEKEADNYGYDFLKKNGKNPWGMVRSFQKLGDMEQQSGATSNYLSKMFSSHPDTKARIKNMTDCCVKDGIAPPEN